MADPKMTSIELDPTEVALVIGEDGGSMTIRVVAATEVAEGATEVPEPHEIAIALAMRLLKDPEFHDSVLDWYDAQDEEDDEDEDEEEELDGKPGEPAKPKA
jgi:hypothetical protein